MTKILYTAKSADGQPVAAFIDAATVAEAKQKLEESGLQDVVFLQAPQTAALSQEIIPDDPQQEKEYAALRARIQEKPGLATAVQIVARRFRNFLLVLSTLFGFAIWSRNPYIAVAALVGLAAPFVLLLWNRRHLDRYKSLLRANAWGEWDQVKRLAAQLRSAPGLSQSLQFDLDVRLAQIQARDGDIAGAVSSLEKWRDADAKAPGLFESRIASVHSAGADYPGYIRMMERAAELSQNDPSRLVDVALANARFGSAAKAQAALALVDTSLLPPVAGSFLTWIEGLLHLRSGAHDAAIDSLRESVAAFRQHALKSPAGWVAFALAAAHCALAEVRSGKAAQAKQTLGGLTHIVSAHADPSLLRMLRSELPELFPAT